MQMIFSQVELSTTPQPTAAATNLTAKAVFKVDFASCIFFTLKPHFIADEDVGKFSIGTILDSGVQNAFYPASGFTYEQPFFSSSCNLTSCNADAGDPIRSNLVRSDLNACKDARLSFKAQQTLSCALWQKALRK